MQRQGRWSAMQMGPKKGSWQKNDQRDDGQKQCAGKNSEQETQLEKRWQ